MLNTYDSEIALHVTRGGIVDARYRADIAVVTSNGQLTHYLGNPQRVAYQRSAAKPFQALGMILSGAFEKYGISMEELAVVCASHFGEDRHVRAVQSILSKIDVSEDYLKCGSTYSWNDEVKTIQVWNHELPNPLFNDCSGKHSGWLATCKALGYDLHSYTLPEHQVQKETRRLVELMCQCEAHVGIDGCTAPTFATPLYNMALGFARLADYELIQDEKLQNACQLVFEAMTSYPFMISGSKDIGVELMENNHKLITKVGAEAIQAVGLKDMELGVAIKTEDGDYKRGLNPVIVETLEQIGAVPKDLFSKFKNIPNINKYGQVVGEIKPVFNLRCAC